MSTAEIPKSFFRYWSFRYGLATELYIVEKWEKITIHILLGVLFLIFAYLNYALIQYVPTLLPKLSTNVASYPVTTATMYVNKFFQSSISS